MFHIRNRCKYFIIFEEYSVRNDYFCSHGMENWVWDHYYETPIMSTYLTAFLIAPLTALMQNKADKVQSPEIKMWARPDGISQTQMPTVYAESILTYLEKYFGMPFPLSKIDVIGVPAHDYNAMENWGLIIFR
jgi:aminopeptidase N